MRRALWVIAGLALVLGAYIQETGGKVESLPAVVQPYARRLHAACEPARRAVGAKLASVTRTLMPARKWDSDEAQQGVSVRAGGPSVKESVRVIAYTDGQDMLRQLRGVPAGTRIDFRALESHAAPVNTGISCCDKAAIAAYMERKNKEMDELNRDIEAELNRIQQAPRGRR
jgi:hypothetical protein